MDPIKFLDDLQHVASLTEFRNRYVKEEKQKCYEEAFECIHQFARIVASMPSYIDEVRKRNAPLEEKEKHIRMIIDLIDKVKIDQVAKFNEFIYQANRLEINNGGNHESKKQS